jgi:hypothetical protein
VFPGPGSDDYRHWGTLKTGEGDDVPEPNNRMPPEYCAACNASQTYGGAYGWADANCAHRLVQMCRIQGGRAGGGAARALLRGGLRSSCSRWHRPNLTQ